LKIQKNFLQQSAKLLDTRGFLKESLDASIIIEDYHLIKIMVSIQQLSKVLNMKSKRKSEHFGSQKKSPFSPL